MKIISKKILKWFFIALLVYPFLYFIYVYNEAYIIIKEKGDYKPNLSTKIYDVNGEIISELFDENRSYVDIKDIPAHISAAFIATEDQDFYRHSGIDVPSIIRALIVDIFSADFRQGGSTVTQQLVKQLYTRGEKTLKRKLLEILIAGEFERKYSKDKILEMYLNQIYFGHGVYGIAAASKFYFNKRVEDLNIVEASVLAALPSAPNRYSPIRNPRLAIERNNQIIFNLVNTGYLTRDEAIIQTEKFWKEYIESNNLRYSALGIRDKQYNRAPYFTEYIRRILVDKYGEETVYCMGLRVHTTLDLRFQDIASSLLNDAIEKQNKISSVYNQRKFKKFDYQVAEMKAGGKKKKSRELKALADFLGGFRREFIHTLNFTSLLFDMDLMDETLEKYLEEYENVRYSSKVEGALVALETRDGGILTMVGGSDFNSGNQLNRAVQSFRQPGSSFKAFVYGAGIESKIITPATAFLDAPVVFKGVRSGWTPSNYGGDYRGKVLARRALASSLNVVAVLAYDMIGGNRIAGFASKLTGVPVKRFEIDPTLALGTTELSPLEITRGFAVYANNGREVVPYAIKYIEDRDGKRIFEDPLFKNRGRKRLISKAAAFLMTSMLRSVVDSGTASGAVRNVAGFKYQAAGKTGTNTDFRDAWFVGYTPDIAASVWLGCDSQVYILGPGQSGSVVAAPVWGKFMKEVYKFRKPGRFPGPPSGVYKANVCSKSGDVPAPGCPVISEYFMTGTKPEKLCGSDDPDMISVFELARKRKEELKQKELQKGLIVLKKE